MKVAQKRSKNIRMLYACRRPGRPFLHLASRFKADMAVDCPKCPRTHLHEGSEISELSRNRVSKQVRQVTAISGFVREARSRTGLPARPRAEKYRLLILILQSSLCFGSATNRLLSEFRFHFFPHVHIFSLPSLGVAGTGNTVKSKNKKERQGGGWLLKLQRLLL